MDEIQIINVEDASAYSDDLVTSRKVLGKANGSESVSISVTTVQTGLEVKGVVYPDHDEVAIVLSGSAAVSFNGAHEVLSTGKVMYVPRGKSYDFKVVEGPVEMVVAFSPANS